ncbi:MAG: DUF4954 family protein [Bacteroides sp.]|nr:DUF4954 family protein [Roseburia sp.]MCM1347231.1 DUF4954 family protein [Bacteroides sp.]MCM1421710.1 DUF4954 family protein [Bacteroides sp.]
MRNLTDVEISVLEEQGCTAEDWAEVLVSEDDFRCEAVRSVDFYGHVEIGSLYGTVNVEDGFMRRCGIRNAVLRNVRIGDRCLIENIHGYISGYDICEECYIADVGTISTQGMPSFGNGNVISVLNEGGDGNVVIYDKLTAQLAALMTEHECVRRMALNEVAAHPPVEHGTIGHRTRIVHTREIHNAVIGQSCEIAGADRLSMATVLSSDDAPTYIGSGAIVENTVVACGASVTDGAKVDNCFVGESVHIGKGFSAESSLFFANSYMDNGEACAAFCGPFSTSHHKSTLLIGGQFSFYNAGSATNQSNHAYKMGPIHWGVLERGTKTASGSHILWPAHIGAFSMVMGKITQHPDIPNLPFSYIIAQGEKTYIVPGINLRTVGTWRDVRKWSKRDMRPLSARRDLITYSFPNPYIAQAVEEGIHLLQSLVAQQGEDVGEYEHENCYIKRTALIRGLKFYDIALRLFAHTTLTQHAEAFEQALACGNDYSGYALCPAAKWMDVGGMAAPEEEINALVSDISEGNITTSDEAVAVLQGINAEYEQNTADYLQALARNESGCQPTDWECRKDSAEEAYAWWLKMVRDDAEREFALGDVEEQQLRDFIDEVR